MNDANAPLNNLDFPNVMSPDAVQRQASYSQQSEVSETVDGANVDALINLVQDLNQQNHELLNRITLLEGELATHKAAIQSDRPSDIVASSAEESAGKAEDPLSSDTFSADHVSHLLNQLEFAQQANQRQDIRVESLSTQLTSCQSQVEQLEAENNDLQQRCGNQLYRLNHLEEECRDLRLRLQRQQRYTLQFKAALEKCLEVPPPSYGFFHARDYAHDMVESFQPPSEVAVGVASADIDTANEGAEESNWLVQPLFPKIRNIKPWGDAEAQALHAPEPCHNNAPSADNEYPSLIVNEPWNNSQSTATLSSSAFASGDRFQSTLLTLAKETQHSEENIAPSSNSDTERSFTEEDSSVDKMTADCASQTTAGQSHDRVESKGDLVDHSEPALAKPVIEQQEESGESVEAIAPFSSGSFPEARKPITPELKPSNDKLWQSLVNLIDMSAADGLNREALPLAQNSSEVIDPLPEATLPQPQDTVPAPINAWADDVSSADEGFIAEGSNPVNPIPDQKTSNVSPAERLEQRDQAAVEHDLTIAAEHVEPPKPVKRAIELPSFLNPGNGGINPNPA